MDERAIRGCVSALPINVGAESLHVTLSLGIAAFDGSADAAAPLRAADPALYRAKRGGRDSAMLAPAPSVAVTDKG